MRQGDLLNLLAAVAADAADPYKSPEGSLLVELIGAESTLDEALQDGRMSKCVCIRMYTCMYARMLWALRTSMDSYELSVRTWSFYVSPNFTSRTPLYERFDSSLRILLYLIYNF